MTATITGKLANPGAAPRTDGKVTFVLVDYSDRPVLGFNAADQTSISSALLTGAAPDGQWSAQLTPNPSIQLAGGVVPTAYRVTETGGSTDTYWIVVPSGAGPYWVGDLRTTLVGGAAPNPVTNLAVSGALTVGGAFTLDGIAIGAPPNDSLKFLNGTGAFSVPGGGPPSGAAGGDLLGSSYPNPLLASTANVRSIIDARIPTGLPPTGAAGGDLAGTYPAPTLAATANVEAIIRANRLDQFAAPAADVAMGGHKLTGGAAGTAPTDFVIVSQVPTSARDPYTAMLGLVGQPFPLDANDHDDLGVTSGFLICALIRPGAGPVTNLGLWLAAAGGTPTGVSSMALFSESGTRLGVTGDMTAALTNGANTETYVEAALGTPYTAADATDYYVGILCQLTTNPKIAGVFGTSSTLHIPMVKGHRPMIVVGGQSSMPATIDVAGATTAGAAYWLVAS